MGQYNYELLFVCSIIDSSTSIKCVHLAQFVDFHSVLSFAKEISNLVFVLQLFIVTVTQTAELAEVHVFATIE